MTNCDWCGKPTDTWYVIADDLEAPRPFHTKCVHEMLLEVWILEEERKRRRKGK